MANNVTVVVLGGQPKVINGVSTVNDAVNQLSLEQGLAVTVNGKSGDYSTTLADFSFVSFGAKVKGGNK